MIYLPWVAFLLAVLWMVREGNRARTEYLRQKQEQQKHAKAVEELEMARAISLVDATLEALRARTGVQGQVTGLAEAFGGQTRGRGPGYGTGSGFAS